MLRQTNALKDKEAAAICVAVLFTAKPVFIPFINISKISRKWDRGRMDCEGL